MYRSEASGSQDVFTNWRVIVFKFPKIVKDSGFLAIFTILRS